VTLLELDFKKLQAISKIGEDVLPVVVQHAMTRDVLTLAYTNFDALIQTQETGIATFWSTSRNALWVKGATSGNYLKLVEIRVNCENNSLLYLVEPQGAGVCHVIDPTTGVHNPSCFFNRLASV
jgi:phosphoribosyl-AMP cyclohydrolase